MDRTPHAPARAGLIARTVTGRSLLVQEAAALVKLHPAPRRGLPARLPGLDVLVALRRPNARVGDCKERRGSGTQAARSTLPRCHRSFNRTTRFSCDRTVTQQQSDRSYSNSTDWPNHPFSSALYTPQATPCNFRREMAARERFPSKLPRSLASPVLHLRLWTPRPSGRFARTSQYKFQGCGVGYGSTFKKQEVI